MKCATLWCVVILAATPASQLMAQEAKQPAAAPQTKPSSPIITLLDAGQAPRSVLRFSVVKDASPAMFMTMQMSIQNGTMKMQGMPAMTVVYKLHIAEVQPNGDFACDFVITDVRVADAPGLPPSVSASVRDSMKSIIGMTMNSTMTNRGLLKNMERRMPPDANAMAKNQVESVRDSMNQFVTPLPEEAVGVGGKWKVQSEISVNGMNMTQESTMTLEKIEGDLLNLQVELKQTAPPQDMDIPGMPPDAKARLHSYASSGHGRMTMSLNNPFPKDSAMQVASESCMFRTVEGEGQSIEQKMEMTMTMKEGEPPAAATPLAPPAAAPTAPAELSGKK
ncbi:MAG: hypothetical protein K8R92_11895 [Planctomycetes bacterium]|nr:hypothetical protein [Planctomycetota bacterium]